MGSSSDQFIERLLDAFPDTKHKTQVYERQFEINGLLLRVVAPSQELGILLTRALDHIAIPRNGGSIDLRIEIHDGARAEFFNWVRDSWGNQVQRVQTDTYMCLYNPGIGGSSAKLSFFDYLTGRAIFWIPDSMHIPWYELATPFRTIFHWFFSRHGIEMIHSASIGKHGKGILLIGKGGSGKTSTALAAVMNKYLMYAGDDYVLLQMDPVPTAMSLYCTAKVETANLDGEKEVRFLHDTHSKNLVKKFLISAILLPVIARADVTTWKKLHPAHALIALAPSTIFQLQPEDTHHDSFTILAGLVKKVPSFQLLLGTRAEEIALQLEMFLDEL